MFLNIMGAIALGLMIYATVTDTAYLVKKPWRQGVSCE